MRGTRGVAIGLAAMLAAVAGAASGAAAAEPPIVSARDVLPLGQSGDPASPHFADQLPLYTGWQFKSMSLAPPAGATLETLANGVRIYRDSYGVPYVRSSSDVDTAYGAGWAEAEDRFAEMDVLRHEVEGRLAELIPPALVSPTQQAALVAGDATQRAAAPTDASLLAQLMRRPAIERQMIQAFAQGINDWVADAGRRGKLPVEYLVLGTPEPWRAVDSLQIAAYMARSFGQAGGRELQVATVLNALRARFPPATRPGLADRLFDDLVFRSDPGAPTTVPGRTFRYETGGEAGVHALGVAVPDAATTPAFRATAGNGPFPLGARVLASNAIAVSGARSADGHNLLIGGPQVGQYQPQILVELALRGNTINARGVTFPGAGPVVLIGRTRSHAWTFTTGADDQTDTWALLLKPGDPTQYKYKGLFQPLRTRTEVIRERTASGLATAETLHLQYAGQGHGLVIAHGTVRGVPVAFSRSSTIDGHELGLFGTIFALNREQPWRGIASQLPSFPAGFNLMYADPARIAYYHLGWYPVRSLEADDRLPTWGTGDFDWQGRVPWRAMPHAVNPSQGWLANWNNKPVAGWLDGDSTPWGAQTRVTMLQDQLRRAHRLTPARLVHVIRHAAYLDARVKRFRPIILASARGSTDPLVQAAAAALRAWDGMRIDRNGDGTYDSPGEAILDQWWTAIQTDLLSDHVGATAYTNSADRTFDDEFWGRDHASLLLHVLQGSRSSAPLQGPWPRGKRLQAILATAFSDAVHALATQYGTTDVSRWLEPRENFTYTSFSTLVTPPANVAHMNRGTFNEVIELGR
jgi:penicillin amidase